MKLTRFANNIQYANAKMQLKVLSLNSLMLSPLQGGPGCEYCRITRADVKRALGFNSIEAFGSKSDRLHWNSQPTYKYLHSVLPQGIYTETLTTFFLFSILCLLGKVNVFIP